jgi:capsular polysaccharide biosynthesis protein
MKTILTKVVEERDKLVAKGKTPDSVFLSRASLNKLLDEAVVAYSVQRDSIKYVFLEMHIYCAEQYLGETFRIYCKPSFVEAQSV